ncbi:hypothetical protein C8Q75DRAFT_382662 [Abortiporus biennis]|nr:hypothetical protein C8Q75DRAFT_382662 [Abortiporus biennis]
MTFMDTLQSTVSRVLPEKKNSIPLQASGGIGSGHVPFEDDVSILGPPSFEIGLVQAAGSFAAILRRNPRNSSES